MSAPITGQMKSNAATRELWWIAGNGDLGRLKHLLDHGADINGCDGSGMTALMRAAYHGQLRMVQALIEHGADLNAADDAGLTALTLAQHSGHEEVAETLVSAGAGETSGRRAAEATREKPDDTSQSLSVATPAPRKQSKVRTLHDPPEIWELVHETRADVNSESTPARRFTLSGSLWVAVMALIVGAIGIFGFVMLRTSRVATDATPARALDSDSRNRSSAASDRPATASDQLPSTELTPSKSNQITKSSERAGTASSSGQTLKAAPADPVGVRTADPESSRAAPARASTGQSATKTRQLSPTKLTTVDSEMFPSDKPSTAQPKSDSDKNANSPAAKKEPEKAQTLPVSPAKASPSPKPKVIQWP